MFSVADVVTQSLRYVSVVSPYDIDAPAAEFDIALQNMNMILAEQGAANTKWYNVPTDQEVLLKPAQALYDLEFELSTKTKLMMVIDAHLKDNTTKALSPLKLLRRSEFSNSYEEGKTGHPDAIYIDKLTEKTMWVMPMLPTGSTQSLSVVLTGIGYPVDVAEADGKADLGYPDAYARYFALLNAVDIGQGPVVTLSPSRIDRLAAMADRAKISLEAFTNRENVKRPRYTKPRSF